MAQKTRVAVVQHCAGIDVSSNLDTLTKLSRRARAAGAEVICWAEAFAYLGRHEGKREILEPLPKGGPILDRCQSLAAELGCELLLGGFHEAMPDDPQRCYNTSVYLGANGDVLATYRKIHLFDVDIPDGPRLQESKQTGSGSHSVTTETLFGTLGLTICYDVRFPTLYQTLVNRGVSPYQYRPRLPLPRDHCIGILCYGHGRSKANVTSLLPLSMEGTAKIERRMATH